MCLWCISQRWLGGIVQEVPEKSIVQFLSSTWHAGRRQKHLGSEWTRMLLIDVMLVLTECGGVRALLVFYSCQHCVKNESSIWTDCMSDYSLLEKKKRMWHIQSVGPGASQSKWGVCVDVRCLMLTHSLCNNWSPSEVAKHSKQTELQVFGHWGTMLKGPVSFQPPLGFLSPVVLCGWSLSQRSQGYTLHHQGHQTSEVT